MQNVVFTGPAIDSSGLTITRQHLIEACKASGKLTVQSGISLTTDLLVASRTDTVKAQRAAARGVEVIGYPEFLGRFLRDAKIERGGSLNPYVDKLNQELIVPFFVDAHLLAEKDVL